MFRKVMRSLVNDKRGQTITRTPIRTFLVLFLLGAGILVFALSTGTSALEGTEYEWVKNLGDVFSKYIFGIKDGSTFDAGTFMGTSGQVLTFLMVWMIIFIAFGDIIATFSAFSKSWIAWVIAFGLAVIAANTGMIQGVFVMMTGWFIWAGTAAVYVGLLAAFISFIILNWAFRPLLDKFKLSKDKQTVDKKVGEAVEGTNTMANLFRGLRYSPLK